MSTTQVTNRLSASDLLTLSSAQISERIKSNRNADGSYSIEGTGDLATLPTTQREAINKKIRDAVVLLEGSLQVAPQAVSADALSARLGKLVVDANGSAEGVLVRRDLKNRDNNGDNGDNGDNNNNNGHDRGSDIDDNASDSSNDTRSTSTTPSADIAPNMVAEGSYNELLKRGGRPVCSVETLRQIVAGPNTPFGVLEPWLLGPVDTGRDRDGAVANVFDRQLERWWGFLKSQWLVRNPPPGREKSGEGGSSDAGPFAAFLEFKTAVYERMGAGRATRRPSFQNDMRHIWMSMPDPRTSAGAGADATVPFQTYCDQVTARLAQYHFCRPLDLHNDPRQQKPWTTWLEYLNFELDYLEQFTRALARQAPKYNQAWETLRNVEMDLIMKQQKQQQQEQIQQQIQQQSPDGVDDSQTTSQTAISDFLRQTAAYRQIDDFLRRQQACVQWVVAEARSMDAEMDDGNRCIGGKPYAGKGNGGPLNEIEGSVLKGSNYDVFPESKEGETAPNGKNAGKARKAGKGNGNSSAPWRRPLWACFFIKNKR